jgi:hypothetical protein
MTLVSARELDSNYKDARMRDRNPAIGIRPKMLAASLAFALSLLTPAARAANEPVVKTSLACATAAGSSSFFAYSWSFSSNPGQKPQSVLVISKPFDRCSAALFRMSSGGVIKSVSLRAPEIETGISTTIELVNASVTNYQLTETNTGPLESIAFTFDSVSFH